VSNKDSENVVLSNRSGVFVFFAATAGRTSLEDRRAAKTTQRCLSPRQTVKSSPVMFIDRVKIYVKAGDGGDGVTAFRREKFVPRGGPSGGDGGVGGDVWLESDEGLNTLLHLRYNPEHKAERGRHGEGSNRSGRDGESITVKVPVGTQAFDAATGELLCDLTVSGQRFLAAKGGKGGWGNAHFATPTRRAPRFHYTGRPGEEREIQLELKLIADVGLVGFPNAGKSTLISVISAAKPKIADYPFTTLEPNLGVVDLGDFRTFVVADIPGLIEGASEGAGLGDRFLRHVERTKLILHLVDVSSMSGQDPVSDYETICNELRKYDSNLASRPQIVVAAKVDAIDDPERLERLRDQARIDGKQFIEISSVTNIGIRELVRLVARRLDEIGPDADIRTRNEVTAVK
jgi:GTPase